MSRGISNLLTLLIVVTIVIGIAGATSGIIGDFLIKEGP